MKERDLKAILQPYLILPSPIPSVRLSLIFASMHDVCSCFRPLRSLLRNRALGVSLKLPQEEVKTVASRGKVTFELVNSTVRRMCSP